MVVNDESGSASAVEYLKSGGGVIGLDIEYVAYIPPTPAGPPGSHVATLQLAKDGKKCFIWLPPTSGLFEDVRALLADGSILKVGVGAKGDATRLAKIGAKVSGLGDIAEKR